MSSCTLSGSSAASFEEWFSSVHKAQQRAAAPAPVVVPVPVPAPIPAPVPVPAPIPAPVPAAAPIPAPVPVPVSTPETGSGEKKKSKKDKKDKGMKGGEAPAFPQEPVVVVAQEPEMVPEQEPVPVMGLVDGLKAMLQAQFGPMAEAMLLGLKVMPEDKAAEVISSVVKKAMDNLPAIAGKAAAVALHRGQAGAQTAMFAELGNLFGGITLPEVPAGITPEVVQPEQQPPAKPVVEPELTKRELSDKIADAYKFHQGAIGRTKVKGGLTLEQTLLQRGGRADKVRRILESMGSPMLVELGVPRNILEETVAYAIVQDNSMAEEFFGICIREAVICYNAVSKEDRLEAFKLSGLKVFSRVCSIAGVCHEESDYKSAADFAYELAKAEIEAVTTMLALQKAGVTVAEGEVVEPQQEEIPVEVRDLQAAAKAVNTRA